MHSQPCPPDDGRHEGPGRNYRLSTFCPPVRTDNSFGCTHSYCCTIYPRVLQHSHSPCKALQLSKLLPKPPRCCVQGGTGRYPSCRTGQSLPAHRCVSVYGTVPSLNLLPACSPGDVSPIFLIQMEPKGYFSYVNLQKWNHGCLHLAERRQE